MNSAELRIQLHQKLHQELTAAWKNAQARIPNDDKLGKGWVRMGSDSVEFIPTDCKEPVSRVELEFSENVVKILTGQVVCGKLRVSSSHQVSLFLENLPQSMFIENFSPDFFEQVLKNHERGVLCDDQPDLEKELFDNIELGGLWLLTHLLEVLKELTSSAQ